MNKIQQNWKSLKKDFINKIPKEWVVKFEISDYEKDDPKYGHPIVSISEDMYIRSQIDLDGDKVYGHTLHCDEGVTFNIEDIDLFVGNFDEIKKEIQNVLTFISASNKIISEIHDVQTEFRHSLIDDINKKSTRRKALRSLYNASEFLENERLV